MKIGQLFCLSSLMMTFLFSLSSVSAQHFNIHNPIILPDKSQESVITQRIGYTDITITYHSPGAKGREIWGGLCLLKFSYT